MRLPLVGRLIPIVADEYADPEMGSGAVKITPAHDFNDFKVGERHDLPLINIFDADARINDNAPDAYRGLPRFDARKKVVADLEAAGLIEKIEDHTLKLPHHDRSGEVIEPWLTDQWFCNAADAGEAGDRRGRERPHPVRAAAMGEHVFRVDAQHPALVHLAAIVVGPPDPGLVRPRRRGVRRRDRGGSGGRGGGALRRRRSR